MFRFLFPLNLFLGAFLLFSIQPMAAKVLLPIYGGTPETWTLCMLFFQIILLLAYAYVTLFPLIKKPKQWALLHTLLICISLGTLPIFFNPLLLVNEPEHNILLNLFKQLGISLLVVGATAPLLQFLYSQTLNKGAKDPYFLYSASNLGSLIALIIYPFLVERFLGLYSQFFIWNLLYGFYLILLLSILFLFPYYPTPQTKLKAKVWPWKSIALWILLSFIPCSLMLGITLYITTDIAATPLFWIVPLALYLLTFVLSFTTKPLLTTLWITNNILSALVFILLPFIFGPHLLKAWQLIVLHLLGFFMLALMCHSELYKRRPPAQQLTLFYFCLAIGGVLAGIVNGIIAPKLFNNIYEYPIAILLSLCVIPGIKSRSGWWLTPFVLLLLILNSFFTPTYWLQFPSFKITVFFVVFIIIILHKNKADMVLSIALLFWFIFLFPIEQGQTLFQQRNFYGVKRVVVNGSLHTLINQSTLHGLQFVDEVRPIQGISSYYGAIFDVVRLIQQYNPKLNVSLIGLGTGTSLCQFRANDTINIIEIDAQVIGIARNPNHFTYLNECLPKKNIINNDGRLALNQLKDSSQDLIILDAFSSDAIPVHLLTLEAMHLYEQKLAPGGVILINLSNRHLDLMPVINAVGRSLDMITFYIYHKGEIQKQQLNSRWVLLTKNEPLSFQLGTINWHFLTSEKQLLWTDDYSNIIPLLR